MYIQEQQMVDKQEDQPVFAWFHFSSAPKTGWVYQSRCPGHCTSGPRAHWGIFLHSSHWGSQSGWSASPWHQGAADIHTGKMACISLRTYHSPVSSYNSLHKLYLSGNNNILNALEISQPISNSALKGDTDDSCREGIEVALREDHFG